MAESRCCKRVGEVGDGSGGLGSRAGELVGEALRSGAPSRGGVSLGWGDRGDARSLQEALPAPVHGAASAAGAGWGLHNVIQCSLTGDIELSSVQGDKPGGSARAVGAGISRGGRWAVERERVIISVLESGDSGLVEKRG